MSNGTSNKTMLVFLIAGLIIGILVFREELGFSGEQS